MKKITLQTDKKYKYIFEKNEQGNYHKIVLITNTTKFTNIVKQKFNIELSHTHLSNPTIIRKGTTTKKFNSKKYWISLVLFIFILLCIFIYKYINHNIYSNQDNTFNIKKEDTDNNERNNKIQNNDTAEDKNNLYDILVFQNNEHCI